MQAQVGGKIAQLGARLIDATAKSMADQFFDRFTAQLTLAPTTAPVSELAAGTSDPHGNAAPYPTHAPPPPAPASISMLSLIPSEPFGLPLAAWIGGALFLVVLLLLYGSSL